MQRVQFYPDKKLFDVLKNEASTKGVSVSTLVTDILVEYYGLNQNATISVTNLTMEVFKEVENYISTVPVGTPFDLNKASATFRKIDMTCGKKPNAIRATIGRSFGAKLGNAPFSNVRKCVDKNGKQVLSENNALMYEVY